MFVLLFKGVLLLIPTLGVYRFWLVTQKRRFYWSNTEIDGNTLEYTGSALQLLVGFMFAVVIFLPIYGVLIYLSVAAPALAAIGYGVAAVVVYFLMGYAMFRSRRFRLTRTLWRGVRLQQTGSAWKYAFKRLLWTFAMIITLGLVYPFMAESLWRYRYEHTWFGDRKFTFTARWTHIAKPFYFTILFLLALTLLAAPAGLFILWGSGASEFAGGLYVILVSLGLIALWYFAYLFVQSRVLSRFWSGVRLGEARLEMKITMLSLFLRHLAFVGMFIVATFFMAFLLGILFSIYMVSSGAYYPSEMTEFAQPGIWMLVLGALGYLVVYGAWVLISELYLSFTFWKLVANGASIENVDDLRTVKTAGEESPLAGEGLADALNVGAY